MRILSGATPRKVVPPLLPSNWFVHCVAYDESGIWRTPSLHATPDRAVPDTCSATLVESAAAGGGAAAAEPVADRTGCPAAPAGVAPGAAVSPSAAVVSVPSAVVSSSVPAV